MKLFFPNRPAVFATLLSCLAASLSLTGHASVYLDVAIDHNTTATQPNKLTVPLSLQATPQAMQIQARLKPIDEGGDDGGGSGGGSTDRTFLKDILAQTQVNFDMTPETTELLGEKIDQGSGAISFSQVDVSLPGNNALPVQIRRSYHDGNYTVAETAEFGDWSLDLPAISTTLPLLGATRGSFWEKGLECSGTQTPPILWNSGEMVLPEQFWNGVSLLVNGEEKPLLNYGATDKFHVTKDHWRTQCYRRADGMGEGYRVTSPDGTNYFFDVPHAVKKFDHIRAKGKLELYQVFLRVSKIVDVHGNVVNYSYSAYTTPSGTTAQRLTKISSTDGRTISIGYQDSGSTPNLITSVSANNKVWYYSYAGGGSGADYLPFSTLRTVTLPAASPAEPPLSWQIQLQALHRSYHRAIGYDQLQREETNCDNSIQRTATASIKHPSGVEGTFVLTRQFHGRTQVPTDVEATDVQNATNSHCYLTMSLTRKTLTGAGLGNLNWSYRYSQNAGSYSSKNHATPAAVYLEGYDSKDLKTTTVTAPDGSVSTSVFYRGWNYLENQQVGTIYYDTDGVTELKRVVDYFTAGTQATPLMSSGNFRVKTTNPRKLKSLQTITAAGATAAYSTEFSDFNAYDVPQTQTEYNSLNSQWKKYTKTAYQHHTSLHVLNLPTQVQVSADGSNFTTVTQTSYVAADQPGKFKPQYVYQFGRLQQSHSYSNDGLLLQTVFSNPAQWVKYGDYYRGKARSITVPARYSSGSVKASLAVDADGRITAFSDFNGQLTSYSYDQMGRVTAVTPSDPNFTPTRISYQLIDDTNIRLVQQIRRGQYAKDIYLDGLLRPVLDKEWDTSAELATVRYINRKFNHYNQPLFQSVPASFATESFGSTSRYDGLQRLLSQTNTADGHVTYSYGYDNSVTQTNGRGYATTTHYRAYGSPEQSLVVSISQPEQVVTSISHNLFGNPVLIQQGSQQEIRRYNSYQQLCLLKRADIGIKVLNYNNYGQHISFAEGLTGQGNHCTDYTSAQGTTVTLSYDNLGEQHTIHYPDGTPEVSYNYDASGNLLSLNNGHSSWAYRYNSQHQLTAETLSLDGKIFAITSDYNALGHLNSRTYGGATLSYQPNALGQPTQVKEASTLYASNVQYHPNNQLSSFTYGNGLRFSQTLNAQYQPEQRLVSKAGQMQLGQHYNYDATQNVDTISDLVNARHSLSLGYDGLDRLVRANGSWGNGWLSYDTLGNIKTKHFGAQTLNYQYNSNNLLLSIPGHYQFIYDDRGNVIHNGQRSFNFNRANQLISSGTASYRYDGHNRRVHKSGNTQGYSVYNVAGQLLLTESEQGQVRYIHLGNTLLAKAGMVHTPQDNPGYTGHLTDQDLSLTYMQARYYDPVIGRFYSNDPVGFMASNPMMFNRYAYANNNPYKYTDPTGMLSCGASETNCVENTSQQTNQDKSITVSRTDTRTNGSTATTTPSGSITLLPQESANGAIATVTPDMQDKLLDLSENVNNTVNVHSGVRTQAQQNSLSGKTSNTVASTSQHTVGDAADISVTGMSGAALSKAAVNSGSFERVNLYKSGAVHVDQKNVGPGTQFYKQWERQPNP